MNKLFLVFLLLCMTSIVTPSIPGIVSENVETREIHHPTLSLQTTAASLSPSITVNAQAQQDYSDFFEEGEFNAYQEAYTQHFLSNNLTSILGSGVYSYTADIKLTSDDNLLILGGYDNTNVNQTYLNQLFTTTGNELTTTATTATHVGFLVEMDPVTHQINYATMLESPGGNILFYNMEFLDDGSLAILGNNGSVITNGYFPSDYFGGNPDADIYLLKLNATSYDQISNATIGSFGLEILGMHTNTARGRVDDTRRYAISDTMEIHPSGNIIITGSTTSMNQSLGIGFPLQTYPGTTDPTWSVSNVLTEVIANNLTTINQEGFLMSINPDLTVNWSRLYSGLGNSMQRVGALTIDPFGKIYIGGFTEGSGNAAVPTNLFYPNNIYDLVNLNEATSIYPRTIADYRDGFIATFEANGSLHTATHLGGLYGSNSQYDAVHDLEFYGNNTLFVSGEVFLSESHFPYVSPHEDEYPNSYFAYSGGESGAHEPHTGYVLSIDTSNYEVTYSHRFPVYKSGIYASANAITNIEVVNNAIYFTGIMNHGFSDTNLTQFEETGYIPEVTGPLARNATSAKGSDNIDGFTTAFFGVINSSRRVTFLSLLHGDDSVGTDVMQGAATGTFPIVIDADANVYVGYEDLYGQSVQKFEILDSDLDGLADYRETNGYGSNPNLSDTDGDGISDGGEVYGINEFGFTSDPLLVDTDGDCINDDLELLYGLNPRVGDANVDLDNDGINSYDEFQLGLDVNNNDTDGDGLDDFTEVFLTYTNGSEADSDFDGLDDPIEIDNDLDPWDPDMDNDGALDGQEFLTEFVFTFANGSSELRKTDPLNPDTDEDGLVDGIEIRLALLAQANQTNPVMYDADYDGLSDYDELFVYDSMATEADIDADGLNDKQELLVYFTHPTIADIDEDGLNDYDEVVTYGTDPWIADIDKDGLNDFEEAVTYGTNPYLADEDGDGLNDSIEVSYGSNSTNADSDFDLLPDYYEYFIGLNSTLNETYLDLDNDTLTTITEYYENTHPLFADYDNDTLLDPDEILAGTNAFVWDTDGDTLSDGDELNLFKTSPILADSDGDTLLDPYELANELDPMNADSDFDNIFDGDEFAYGTSPTNNDTDDDGILDGRELDLGTDPLLSDTDGDTLSDFEEISTYGTSPLLTDTDGDDLADNIEIELSTDPLRIDTDDDGLEDGVEVSLGSKPNDIDTDGDTLEDGYEYLVIGTNPLLNDTDGDSIPDGWEFRYYSSEVGKEDYPDPIDADDADLDPDFDGVSNLEEYLAGSNPIVSDIDLDNPVENVSAKIANDPVRGWSSVALSGVGISVLGQSAFSAIKNRGKGVN